MKTSGTFSANFALRTLYTRPALEITDKLIVTLETSCAANVACSSKPMLAYRSTKNHTKVEVRKNLCVKFAIRNSADCLT